MKYSNRIYSIKKTFVYERVLLASFSALLSGFDEVDCKAVYDFYAEISENLCRWFCNELCESAKVEYDENTNAKKRFGIGVERYDYSARFSIVYIGDGYVSIDCGIRLKKGNDGLLLEMREEHTWDTQLGILVRPEKKK